MPSQRRLPQEILSLDWALTELLIRKFSKTPRRIHHYTSLATLPLILASGRLRFTHFEHLNDSTELQCGRHVIDELLAAQTRLDDITSQFFELLKTAFVEYEQRSVQYFIASLSVLADSGHLWSRYGDGGSGVSIAFETRDIACDSIEAAPFHIDGVTYSEDQQRSLIQPLIQSTKRHLLRYGHRFGFSMADTTLIAFAAKLGAYLAHYSLALKNREWRHEAEWRAVLAVHEKGAPETRHLVQTGREGRPYVDLPFRSFTSSEAQMPIHHVCAGVTADVRNIRECLDDLGYRHVRVIRSFTQPI